MLALPRNGATVLRKGEDIPWHMAAEVMDYARIMKGSQVYMQEQFDDEINTLQAQEQEDELMFGGDTVEWTRKAVRAIKEAKERVKDIGNPPSLPEKPVETRATRPPIIFGEVEAPEMYAIQHAARSGQSFNDDKSTSKSSMSTPLPHDSSGGLLNGEHDSVTPSGPSSVSTAPRTPVTSRATLATPSPSRSRHDHGAPPQYYFYQALLHYYLSPLDIRILKAAFGQFSSFPSTILPRVEHVSTGHIVDDELRRRTKYLSHLPYGCEVSFLECDWTDTVAPEILEKFKPEIERRRKRNRDKEAREEKARVRAERTEDELRWASARRRRAYSTDKFSSEFQPLSSASAIPDHASSVDADSLAASPPYSNTRQGSAFASLASPSTSPSAPRTVWGTAAVPQLSPGLPPIPQESVPDDGWLQGWEEELRADEAEAFARAEAISLGGADEQGTAAASVISPSVRGKKKKPKKITLMSTNVRRGA
jgi:hypothetical protein